MFNLRPSEYNYSQIFTQFPLPRAAPLNVNQMLKTCIWGDWILEGYAIYEDVEKWRYQVGLLEYIYYVSLSIDLFACHNKIWLNGENVLYCCVTEVITRDNPFIAAVLSVLLWLIK